MRHCSVGTLLCDLGVKPAVWPCKLLYPSEPQFPCLSWARNDEIMCVKTQPSAWHIRRAWLSQSSCYLIPLREAQGWLASPGTPHFNVQSAPRRGCGPWSVDRAQDLSTKPSWSLCAWLPCWPPKGWGWLEKETHIQKLDSLSFSYFIFLLFLRFLSYVAEPHTLTSHHNTQKHWK